MRTRKNKQGCCDMHIFKYSTICLLLSLNNAYFYIFLSFNSLVVVTLDLISLFISGLCSFPT